VAGGIPWGSCFGQEGPRGCGFGYGWSAVAVRVRAAPRDGHVSLEGPPLWPPLRRLARAGWRRAWPWRRPSQGGQREAVSALLGARGGSVRARHLGVVRTAGLLRPFTFFWEFPVRILLPLHRGRRGRPPEGGGVLLLVLLRLVGGLGLLLLLLRALRGRLLLMQLLLLRLLPGNLLLLLLLLFFPRSWTRWVRGVPLLG
jgi:hypothetical protein